MMNIKKITKSVVIFYCSVVGLFEFGHFNYYCLSGVIYYYYHQKQKGKTKRVEGGLARNEPKER